MDLSQLDKYELIELYGDIISELKKKQVIRSKNVVGGIGEYLAIDYYGKTKGLPRLQFAPPSTENIDAISTKGDRYSIKCTTSNTTGVFYGLNHPGEAKQERQLFEYALIVVLNDEYKLSKIIELDWSAFLKHKKWHKRMSAWHLIISQKLLQDATVVFDSSAPSI